jgi:hypothetical protein
MNEANEAMKEEGFEKANGNFEKATTTAVATINEKNEITGVADDGSQFIMNLTSRQVNYCSLKPKTDEESVVLFNAMNNPEKRVKDCVNMTINVTDVFVEVVFLASKEDESIKEPCPRVVLIDENGVGYQAVSKGMYTALQKIFTSFGTPDTWKAPKAFTIRQITKSADRSILTLDAVMPKKK